VGGERRGIGTQLTWATESSNSEGSRPFSFWIFFLAVYIWPSLRHQTLRPRRRFGKQSTDQQPAHGEIIIRERDARSMVDSEAEMGYLSGRRWGEEAKWRRRR